MEIHQSFLFKPVINCFGAPNSGKTTLASHIYSICKSRGANCEKIEEVAKDIVYEKNRYKIWNQPYVFGNQLNRMIRVIEENDFIITDSPLLLAVIYAPDCFDLLKPLARQTYSYFDNYAYILPVHSNYKKTGRKHTKAECLRISEEISDLVHKETNEDRILTFTGHDLDQNTEAIIEHAQLFNFFQG